MRIPWGLHELDLDLPNDRWLPMRRGPMPEPLSDLGSAVTLQLEQPFQYPPLRRALTPEDHVVVVLDPRLAHPGPLLASVLAHLVQARIEPSAITILCPEADQDQTWVDTLDNTFQEVKIETHDPTDRKKLAYLATTRGGRRVYMNRSAVDADQTVVLTRRRYDCHLGYAGGPGILFPGLAEETVLQESRNQLSMKVPGSKTFTLHKEAEEVAWLMGAPFFVQVIEGAGGGVIHAVAGSLESCHEAERLMDSAWHVEADEPADVVLATLTGDPTQHRFEDMARALAHATRAVRPGGRVVLLCDADPELGPACQILRDVEEPHAAKKQLLAEPTADLEAGFLWTTAAERAKLYILSQMSPDTIEEMYATPLDKASQAQKLIADARRVAVLPDAHNTWMTVRKGQ